MTESISLSEEKSIDIAGSVKAGGVKVSTEFSAAFVKDSGESTTTSDSNAISMSCDVLAEHRMYAYITADTYRTKVPWKGIMTKVYWDGSHVEEEIEGMYEAIRVADINVNYGRMTPLSESVNDDYGASKDGSTNVNMDSAFGSDDDFSRNLVWFLTIFNMMISILIRLIYIFNHEFFSLKFY